MTRAIQPVNGYVYVKPDTSKSGATVVIHTEPNPISNQGYVGYGTDAEILLGTVSASGFVPDSFFDDKDSALCLIEIYAAYYDEAMTEDDFDGLVSEWISTH